MFTETETLTPAEETQSDEGRESNTLRVITWFSVGMAVAALGIFLGRELRSRYKFKRRTPYDYYSNAGERQAGEFGVGI
jgi:CRISPR/Cas system-associated protein Cas5 (RAMP superfamily)